MVKVNGQWFMDQDVERRVYQYLRDRLQVLHDQRVKGTLPEIQTDEELRVIDLIVGIDLSHIGV